MLTATGGSERFYKRFGFKFFHSLQPTPTYREDHYVARVTTADRACCSVLLARAVAVCPDLTSAEIPTFARLEQFPSIVSADA
jgi:hypothetical protein